MESDAVEGIYELQRPVTNGGEKCNDSIIRQSQSFSVVHSAALNSLHDLNPLEEVNSEIIVARNVGVRSLIKYVGNVFLFFSPGC